MQMIPPIVHLGPTCMSMRHANDLNLPFKKQNFLFLHLEGAEDA